MLACGTADRFKARGPTASEGCAPLLSHFLIKQATDLPFRARCIPGKESPKCCKRRTGLEYEKGILHMEYPLLFVDILTLFFFLGVTTHCGFVFTAL
jgi:hypothetical protein